MKWIVNKLQSAKRALENIGKKARAKILAKIEEAMMDSDDEGEELKIE